jgi:hypothetical protein
MRSCRTGARGLVLLLGFPVFAALAARPSWGQEVEEAYGLIVLERSPVEAQLGMFRSEALDALQASRDEIRLARAKVESLRRLIREYERFRMNPFFLTLERRRLELQAAEIHLDRLQLQHLRLQFRLRDEYRARRLELEQARELATIR